MEAQVTPTGDVSVEDQHIGHLRGFQFVPDPDASGSEVKALRAAAQKALASEIEARADRLAAAPDDAFVLSNDGTVRWMGDAIAKLAAGEKLMAPRAILIADEQLTGGSLEKVQARIDLWIKAHVAKLLGPLFALEDARDLTGLARGIAFQVVEALGVLERSRVVQDVKALDQEGRAVLRKHGLRFGAYHIYTPQLLKPAPRALSVQLWALKHGGPAAKGVDDLPHLAASGRTSIPVDAEIDKQLYRAAGFRVCGNRAVRVDILERLADLIRPAVTYRPGVTSGDPPAGTADDDGFVVTVSMTSLVGCSGEDFASILKSLGYVSDQRTGPAITVPLVPKAATAPVAALAAPSGEDSASEPEVDGGVETLAGTVDNDQADAVVVDDATVAEAGEATAEPQAATEEPAGPASPDADATAEEPEIALAAPEVTEEATAEPEGPPSDGPTLEPEASSAEPQHSDAVEPATDTEVVAEAATDDGALAAEAGSTEATPAEPEAIEVWRPHRHQHQRRHGRDARQPGRGGFRRESGQDGQRQDARPDGQRQDSQRQDGQRQGAEGRGNRPARGPEDQAAGGGRGGGRWRGGQRPERARDGAPGEQREGGRGGRHDGNRGDRRPDFRGDGRGDRRSGGGPKHDKAPDPNSPFAKLLILKERMESGDR